MNSHAAADKDGQTIKTESNDEVVKVEIKAEEDDNVDDYGCDRFVVKKEVVSDDEDLGADEEMSNSTTDNHDGAVVASNEPSTSARPPSNGVASKQSTASTDRKLNKQKQSQPNRTEKRSKITIEDDDEAGEDEVGGDEDDKEKEVEVDIANGDLEEAKVIVLYLNCTQANCNVQFVSLDHLHDHLRTVHQLAPLQCFATNCNARFDEPRKMSTHIQLKHSRGTRFLCSVCSKEYDEQGKANRHWYTNHLTGRFRCKLSNDCAQVTDTRASMTTHQNAKHRIYSKHYHCAQPGCSASFATTSRLELHELTHRDSTPFHCDWPHCSKKYKVRSYLVKHIRTKHFGLPESMKAQKEKNIVDERDPNEYVRLVADE